MPYEIDESKSFDLLPDGEYEAHLATVEKKLSKAGNEILSIVFEIRKDVSQLGQGRLIFDTINKDKANPQYFDTDKVQAIIRTQPNHPKQFPSEDAAIQYINGIDLRIVLTHTDGTDGYEPKNKIKGKYAFKPSKVGTRYNQNVKAVAPSKPINPQAASTPIVASKNLESIEISEDDLPF